MGRKKALKQLLKKGKKHGLRKDRLLKLAAKCCDPTKRDCKDCPLRGL